MLPMNVKRRIRVLVVDDSMMFREVMMRGLSKDPGIEVIGAAVDAYEARDKIINLHPDVLTLDIEMPRISGVEFLKQLMPQYPLPVVMVSGASEAVFDALNAGAVDFVDKPDPSRRESMDSFINEMIIKIKIASTAKVGHYKREAPPASAGQSKNTQMLIAIGASTGGTEAILEVLRDLPRDIPGIVIVQHMPPVFTKMYADRLNNICQIEVKEAADADRVMPGRALLAPGGFHLRVAKDVNGYYVRVAEGEKVNGHCPSVDVMFDSVADTVKGNAVGVILTGMGNDGAKGMLKMHQNGAYNLGQDEKSCVVYGMPMVAFNLGGVDKQCPVGAMGDEILKYLRSMNGI